MLRLFISSIVIASALVPLSAHAAGGGGGGGDAATEDDAAALEAGAAEEIAAAGSAMDEFKKQHDVVQLLVKSKVPDQALQEAVDQLLDYKAIANLALGGKNRADRRCEPRCAEFEELLARLIRQNYLKRVRQADTGKVEYLGEEKRPRASKVTTRVTFTNKDGASQQVEVAYVMHVVDGKWQVRDMITDGVSLAKNYRYEFGKILRDEGVDGLIARLETKLADLAKTE